MTIKQLGGVFGRNPTFNDVTIEGELTFDGDIDINSDLKISQNFEVVGDSGFGAAPNSNYRINALDTSAVVMAVSRDGTDGDAIQIFNGAVFGTRCLGFGVSGSNGTINNQYGNIEITTSSALIGKFTANGFAPENGKGIDFSATAGTGTSELFDDYEEGYYTATTTPGSGSLTTSYDRLNYTKVGRSCTVSGEIVVDSVSTPGSNLTVSLPFAAASGSERSQRTHFWVFLGTLTGSPTGVASGYIGTAGGTDFEISIYDDFAAVSNAASFLQVGSTIRVGFTYQTA